VDAFIKDERITMALPQQEVFVVTDDDLRKTPKN
jgi:hypothetical protein